MKQRILAVLLVVALLITVGVVAVTATHPDSAACEHCTAENIEWKEWPIGSGEKLLEGGHYYLTTDISVDKQMGIGDAETTDVEVVLDLRGFDVTCTNGSPFYVYPGCEFSLMESNTEDIGIVSGNQSARNGGVIYGDTGTADNRTKINLYGGIITSNVPTTNTYNGGAIFVSKYTDLLVDGATINGGTAAQGGAIYVSTYSTFTMRSGLISGGKATKQGGNIYLVGAGIVAEVSGGTITGGHNTYTSNTGSGGGNFYVGDNAKLTVSGTAVIEKGQADQKTNGSNTGGGNIFIADSGLLTVSGGTIQNGTATSSGGNILARGQFIMTDGQILGGTSNATPNATQGGSSVAITTDKNSKESSISGGSITGGDVSIVRTTISKTLTLSGDPVIECITFRTSSDFRLNLGELESGAQIGLAKASTSGSAAFTAANPKAADYAQYFKAVSTDSTLQAIAVNASNELVVQEQKCPHCDQIVTWTAWTLTNGASNNAIGETHYYLDKDFTDIKSMFRLGASYGSDDVVIDLRGHDMKASANVRVFNLAAGTELFIMDSGVSGVVSGKAAADQDGGTVNMSNGKSGDRTKVTLHSGTLTYNGTTGAQKGGVIYGGASQTEIVILGGEVSNGLLLNNTKTKENDIGMGGCIYSGGIFTMTGGTITGGNAITYGGNIYLTGSGAKTISNAVISNGVTDGKVYGGGNICVNGGTLNITNTVIENGFSNNGSKDSNRGGGNIHSVSAKVYINDGTIIRGGKTTACGGNIFSRDGELHILPGAQILGGELVKPNADCSGESIGIRNSAVTISGGTVDGEITHVRNGWTTFTVSGAPTLAYVDVVPFTYSSTDYTPVITIGEAGVTGGSITVNSEVGAVFTAASNKADTSKTYFHNVNEDLECSVNADNALVFIVPVAGPISAYCEHCGEAAGLQTWLPLTADMITANSNEATLAQGHYYLPTGLEATSRVKLTSEKVCLDLHGEIYTTNRMAFWVTGNSEIAGELAVMDTVGGGKLQGKAGTTYEGGVIRLTAGAATLYDGTLEYIGTNTKNGGVLYINAATFTMNGGHLTGGKTTGKGGLIYGSGEATINLNGGTMDLGAAGDHGDAIWLMNGPTESKTGTVLNVAETATDIINVIDGNTMGVATATMNMPSGISLVVADPAATDYCIWYADPADAMAAYDAANNNYLKMMANTGALVLDGEYAVDLNGLENVNITGGTVLGMDSANDDYAGYGFGTIENYATFHAAPNGYQYITYVDDEGNVSFHRLHQKINAVTLRSHTGGIYYSATWNGDDIVAGMIEQFGIAVKVGAQPTADFATDSKTLYSYISNAAGEFAAKAGKEQCGAVLNNIIVQNNQVSGVERDESNSAHAQKQIYGVPYVQFVNCNGEYEYAINEQNVSYSLDEIVNGVNAAIYDLGQSEEEADQKLFSNYKYYMSQFCKTWCTVANGLDEMGWTYAEYVASLETPVE